MNQTHPFIDDIPAYALGALDQNEAAVLEAHLSTCKDCQAELAAYRSVSEQLLLLNPPQKLPASLRGRLLERLPGGHKAVRLRPSWLSPRFGLSLAVIILFALNIFYLFQLQSLRRQHDDLVGKYENGQIALAMLSSSDTKSIPVNSGNITGSILLDQERNTAMLIIWNLPALQANQTYQGWLIDPQGNRTSAGVFLAEAGERYTTVRISAPSDLAGFSGFGVTVEPAGGSIQPTGQRVFKVDF